MGRAALLKRLTLEKHSASGVPSRGLGFLHGVRIQVPAMGNKYLTLGSTLIPTNVTMSVI